MELTTGVLNLIIGGCAVIAAIVTFGSEIADKTELKFFGNILFKLIVTVFVFSIGIWASITKDNNSSAELKALLRQNNSSVPPTLALEPGKEIIDNGIIDDKKSITLRLGSFGASSTDFNILCSIMMMDSLNKFYYSGKQKLLNPKMVLIAGTEFETGFTYDKKETPKYLYFYIRGTYSNQDKTYTYPIDYVYEYDCLKQHTGVTVEENSRNSIIERIKTFEPTP